MCISCRIHEVPLHTAVHNCIEFYHERLHVFVVIELTVIIIVILTPMIRMAVEQNLMYIMT